MNITDDQLETLRSQLATCKLGHGLGTVDEPCSVAAINLALSGELSDRDPSECMSPVIRRWVISVQDSMPVQMMAAGDEHGDRWRQALVGLAGTRDTKSEAARVAMVIDWMWECLATDWQKWVPTSAHSAWNEMLHEKTARAAYAAHATAADAYAAADAADAAAYAAAADAAAADAADAARKEMCERQLFKLIEIIENEDK